jgi:tRNA-Thr(GGU) m(6)t(6)A37 methyltransferase TsaA
MPPAPSPNDADPLLAEPLRVIGYARTAVADADVAGSRRHIESDLEILPRYAPALDGIEDYSQLIVLFWMHRASRGGELRAHPRGDPGLPLTGVLASRGRAHPNPIGLAVVDLLARRDRVLRVRRLDAYDGTPIIDIKPYDHYDVFPEPRVPDWFRARLAPGR